MHIEEANRPDHASISMRLLGEFGLFADGGDVRPKSRKARGLLAYLALAEGRAASRERIAGLLWSDRGEEQARSSLRQTMAELRQGRIGAGHHIAASREAIFYRDGALRIDIEQIFAAAARRDAGLLAASVKGIGNALLSDLDGLSQGFDEWLRGERVRREEQVVAAVVAAVAAMTGGADPTHIQAILSALDRLSPFNEAVARLHMQADHDAGDAASLHRRHRRLVEDLKREFGTRPSPETTALFDRLTAIGPIRPLPTPAIEGAAAAPAQVTPPTVMVSPLASADPHPAMVALADDCSEDILLALAEQHELRTIALGLLDLDRVQAVCANALSAYMLSGRLRMNGGGLTASLQLGNVASGVVVWSQQLRIPLADQAEALDRIVTCAAGAVAPAIERDLAGLLSEPGGRRDTVTLYARGQRIREQRTLAEAMAAAEILEDVIARDRRHVGARLRLAQLYNTDFRQMIAGHDAAPYRRRALALAEEAVAIDRGNVRARMRLAWCYLRRGDWAIASREFCATMAELSYDADGLNESGFAFVHLGDLDTAEPLMKRAFQLNPFAPADYHADYATLLALRGDAEAAEAHFSVSGENGLLYQAVRLVNLTALPDVADLIDRLAAAFRADFARIWAGRQPPSSDDMLSWTAAFFPLQRPEHAAFMRERLRTVLRRGWPAGRDNSR